jgi:6-phospho-3-hexuloisomerase
MQKEFLFKNSIDYIQKKINGILKLIIREDIEKVINLFFKSNRIFVYGAGRSGLVAKAFAIRLVHLGFQTFVIGETISAPVTKNDLVVIVSGSGETIPAVMTAEISYKLGANIVSITAKKSSGIAKYANVTIFIASACNESERKKYAPLGTLFEASVWILFDGLIADILDRKSEDEEMMRSRHAILQ